MNSENQNPPSAPAYGRALNGLGLNLIVNNVAQSVSFATQVLEAQLLFQKDGFAALKLCGNDFMFHANKTYHSNPLFGSLASDAPRGLGVEIRAYGTDPDLAEHRAKQFGAIVLAGAMDKPHGLREAMIIDADGYVWIPSRPL
jgi:uncharacterized glyoxalase superfamily protein PhnB